MAVNKVIYGNSTVIDLTADTVAADKMIAGTTAHAKDGTVVTGIIVERKEEEIVADGNKIRIPAGYYADDVVIELGGVIMMDENGDIYVNEDEE